MVIFDYIKSIVFEHESEEQKESLSSGTSV